MLVFLLATVCMLADVLPARAQEPDPALAQWYEEAHAYYSAVQSGQEPMPDEGEWNEFLNQMNWAHEQLGRGNWEPATPGDTVYRGERLSLEILDVTRTLDAWSRDVTLIVPSMAATVSVERTTDASVEPPEEVLKVTVTNPVTGAEETFRFHDADDPNFALTIQTPRNEQVEGLTDQVKIQRFTYRKPVRPPPGRRVTGLKRKRRVFRPDTLP